MVQYRITDILEVLIHRKYSNAFLRDSSLHPIDPELFERMPYMKDRLCVLLPASHPLVSWHNVSMMERTDLRRFCSAHSQNIATSDFHISLCARRIQAADSDPESDTFLPSVPHAPAAPIPQSIRGHPLIRR